MSAAHAVTTHRLVGRNIRHAVVDYDLGLLCIADVVILRPGS
jgi:hypothetical protein